MPPFDVRDVPRARRLSLDDFRRMHFVPRVPIVVTDAIDDWPALDAWSNDALVARVGDRPVPAYEMHDGRIALDRATGFRVVRLTVREYVSRLADGSAARLYVRTQLPDTLPELASDLRPCRYAELGRASGRNLWFAARGTITHCHFDLPDNVIAVVRGEKEFLLFAPSEGRNLYRRPLLSSAPHVARVDLAAPDVASFPRLRRARGWRAHLRRGDLLYIPPRYWHWARAVQETLSVNHWFSRPVTRALLAGSNLYKRLRALEI